MSFEFSGSPTNNTIINNVFSGFYFLPMDETDKPNLYNFSSAINPINNFTAPFDAVLYRNTGDNSAFPLVGVGEKIDSIDAITSNVYGYLYSNQAADIYGVCHGFGRDNLTYYNGYNFYNAFYAPGYFTPPYGENISILDQNISDTLNVLTMGTCNPMNLTEYTEYFGINSIADPNIGIVAVGLNPGEQTILSSPSIVCVEDAIPFYFDEIAYNLVQGTTQQLGSTTFFNGNPIPTALDNFEIRVNGRYAITVTDNNGSGANTNNITFKDGRAIPSYNANSQQSRFNNLLCTAQIFETDVSLGIGSNGIQLVDAPDVGAGDAPASSQTSFFGVQPWNLWHFQYEQNADTFPFFNDFTPVSNAQLNNGNGDQGTALFNEVLAVQESYWQNRQCPGAVHFLPYTFGGAINACPSYYFDVPYYAAIGKFGFYGTRFLNSCASLNLQYPLSGVNNTVELEPQTDGLFALPEGQIEPAGIDNKASGNYAQYDNLLSIAAAEQQYSYMYALNSAFFLWANNSFIQQSSSFQYLNSTYGQFIGIYSGMILPFQNIFGNGISGLTQYQPSITLSGNNIINTGNVENLLTDNSHYNNFLNQLGKFITGQDISYWNQIADIYSYYVSDGNGINEPFYNYMVTGTQSRLLTRYFENLVKGNPIDLFPLNNISFSTDSAKDFLESTGWNRSVGGFGLNSALPPIQRRYFAGAYGSAGALTGLMNALNQINISPNSSYYPGSFSQNIGKNTASNTYYPVISGKIVDNQGHSFSASGWMALGYNEIGKLDANFSCFTPIFVQNPLPEISCKIGQAPTFRSFAVDYHTIPDDKINGRWPEITYWAQKLKMLDSTGNYLYPMSYKWFRVPTASYAGFLQSGAFSICTASQATGTWCCMEGDTNTCTLIHPSLCDPTGQLEVQDKYTFIKGAIASPGVGVNGDLADDQYTYFCVASGRFGIRISEPSTITIEDWARFDVSFKNGINQGGTLAIDFNVVDYLGNNQSVSFTQEGGSPAYNGYMYDPYAIPEAQILQKVPPPNAGYGDVTAFQFVGPIKYVGALRSYSPSALVDTRGVREAWGHMLDYGSLVPFYKVLTQTEGDLLYGHSHLPICTNYQMSPGEYGIQVQPTLNGNPITHWTLGQTAVASYDVVSYGLPWQQIENLGCLYPPITTLNENYESFGVGSCWQYYNNLGAIKRFGYLSNYNSQDVTFIGNGAPSSNDSSAITTQLQLIKQAWIRPNSLAGSNCGYTPYGLGRNMIFYIESFGSFYSYCDPNGKKNIQDISYMNPGIRQGNSAIQYFWLGQPNNIYLERRPLYGPYAYQWRVRRHNRDRNGNGISLSFYSMGYSEPYSLIYDAPAIYGLYTKTSNNPGYIEQATNIVNLRNTYGFQTDLSVRGFWFGTTNGEGTASNYGNAMVDCTTTPTNALCNYFSVAQEFAGAQNMSDYYCSQKMLLEGACFDPCMSMRYGQGIFPGGKLANLFGNGSKNTSNVLVAGANNINNQPITVDEISKEDPSILFRSPINTPYSQLMIQNGKKVVGISTCSDFGSDHCNFLTPTLFLGTSSFIQGLTSSFLATINQIESLIGNAS